MWILKQDSIRFGESAMQLFLTAFQSVPDPRAANVRHNLAELLIIAFLAVLCGATCCVGMQAFGEARLDFLKRFLTLRYGVPSHDAFSTVLRMLDPKALDVAFGGLTKRLVAALGDAGVIAIDGKSLTGAYDKGKASEPEMMVSADTTGLRLTLATVAAKKRNEVDAALAVLDLVDLKGKIVTADALHCHRKMAAKIIEKGGDYCLALKGNQDLLLSDARACLGKIKADHPTARTEAKGHGRIETRIGVVVSAAKLGAYHEFVGLRAFGRIEATRTIDGKTTTDVRIFALSRALPVKAFMTAARAHWEIENKLHWGLDVAMREDEARNRRDHGPANLAVLRRRARDVAARDTGKGSLSIKLKRTGWNEDYLVELLHHLR
jgi:predicted transposase YbfD/YdcC